ncbi:MAG: hypothetical protein HZA30_00815, partial [Candidatus Omnitrophica bacterium]|nr:hypothetical protein [Candidatus Omnitrophota bacterium]
SWKNVFKTIIPEKNHILSIEVSKHNPENILIGTKNGIFISDDLGHRWQDISANLKKASVKCLAMNEEAIYAGGNSGLYIRRKDSTGWERLLVRNPPEKKAGEEEALDAAEPEEEDTAVNCIAIKDNRIYIGMDKDILYSEDGGRNWRSFPHEGLTGIINYILAPSKIDKLYCATTKGVFEFVKDRPRWLELYKGMDKNSSVNNIIFDTINEDSLWALTDRGVYRLESERYAMDQHIDIERNLKSLKIAFDNEPAFQELQQAAIRFAEVSPEKIKNWRREARLRALMPRLSFGIDRNRSTNSEIYTSATRDYVVFGPDDETNRFDMSISWELGDMIWSDDQTNIDVRSRLMVQLRNDILDDLRRAYYERKRIQFELMAEPPKDLKTRFEKELRLQELTSTIDDLTGNYLSERIRQQEQYSLVDRLD